MSQPKTHAEHRGTGFNARIGLGITLLVGTMWAAYAFAGLALLSLPAALKTGDLIVIVAWIAQTFLQLVLLPIIIVGQNIQAKAADERAELTFKDTELLLQLIRENTALTDAVQQLTREVHATICVGRPDTVQGDR